MTPLRLRRALVGSACLVAVAAAVGGASATSVATTSTAGATVAAAQDAVVTADGTDVGRVSPGPATATPTAITTGAPTTSAPTTPTTTAPTTAPAAPVVSDPPAPAPAAPGPRRPAPTAAVTPPVAARTTPLVGTYTLLPDESGLDHDATTVVDDPGTEPAPRSATVIAPDGELAAAEVDPSLSTGDQVAVAPDGSTTKLAAAGAGALAVLPHTPTTHTVTVIGLVPSDGSASGLPDLQASADLVNHQVRSYWSSQTDGQVSFTTGTPRGWYQARSSCADPSAFFNEARASAGFTAAADADLVVIIPAGSPKSCSYGLGTIGSLSSGGYLYATAGDWTVLAHELGHNLGLNHSDGTTCASTTESGCTTRAYASDGDIMGSSGPTKPISNLSSGQLATLGVGASIPAVTSSTRLRLTPLAGRSGQAFSNGNAGVTAVEPGTGVRYYAEYRTVAGRDADVGRRQAGVLVWRDSTVTRNGFSQLERSDGSALVLQPGQTFTTSNGALAITADALTAGSAQVDVVLGGVAATDAAFAPMTLDPPRQLSPGVWLVSGRAWAQDGIVSWSVTSADGTQRVAGRANTQRGDEAAPWQVTLRVPNGSWVLQAQVDNPGGTGTESSQHLQRVAFTVG